MTEIETNNLTPSQLVVRLLALEKEVELQREELDVLREKRRKIAKKEFTDTDKLTEMKTIFLRSEPHNRQDPFSNWELVFWASYLLSNTSRREKLDSIGEVAKRGHKIQKIVEFYIAGLKRMYPDELPQTLDAKARSQVKNFLEYVLLTHETLPTKNGPVPMGFYIAISDWSVTQFSSKVASWNQSHQIEDRPPK